jgi:hypothetical protein
MADDGNAELLQARIAELAKEQLETLMSDISEDAYCAGWMMDLEFDLWRAANSPKPYPYGMMMLDEERHRLKRLAEEAGGWWTFDDDRDFCPMNEWLKQFAAHEEFRRK